MKFQDLKELTRTVGLKKVKKDVVLNSQYYTAAKR